MQKSMDADAERNNPLELSVVIPVYNSATIFPELHRRLTDVLEKTAKPFEIVAILDGCRDRSWEVISEISARDKRVKAIEFSRNFGHQAAITAGLRFVGGAVVVVMDDDLEDPPEILPRFLSRVEEGFDVVYGVRKKRQRSLVHRVFYKAFYRVLGVLVDLKIPYDAGDFCVMTRKVVDALNAMPETNRYLRGMRAWCGFAQTGIEYDRGERFASESGYTFKKYITLAFDAIFSFSYRPLKLVSLIGFAIAAVSFLCGLRLIVGKLSGQLPDVPGWASLLVSVLFLSGIQLVAIGIIGEYLARIYDEVKQRPKFLIRNSVGVDRKDSNG